MKALEVFSTALSKFAPAAEAAAAAAVA